MRLIWCIPILLLNYLHLAHSWSGKVVFEENFNGNSLDLNKWEYQEGCSEIYGSRNLQCYSRNNVAVRNGNLVITAKKEKKEDKDYTSGRIRQKGGGFAYGAYVVRAQLARGDHLWPAIWLLPNDNNCRYEEIDIAEYRGQPSEAKNLEMAAHWGRRHDQATPKGDKKTAPFDLSKGFHEYAVLWTKSKLEWYIDNTKYFEASLTDGTFTKNPNKLPCRGSKTTPFTDPTNFILNLAVGGPFFDGFKPMDPKTWTKTTMEIDWIRVYQG